MKAWLMGGIIGCLIWFIVIVVLFATSISKGFIHPLTFSTFVPFFGPIIASLITSFIIGSVIGNIIGYLAKL